MIKIQEIKERVIEIINIVVMISLAIVFFFPVAIILWAYMIVDYSYLCYKSKRLIPDNIYIHLLNNKLFMLRGIF